MSNFFIPIISTVQRATLTLNGLGERPGGLVPNEFVAVKASDRVLLRAAATAQIRHTVATSQTAVGFASNTGIRGQDHVRYTDTSREPSIDELLTRFGDWSANTAGLHLLVIEDLGHLKTPPSKSLERLRAWLRRNGKTAWVGLYADPSNRRTRAPEWGGLYQATYRAELVALPKQVRLEL